MNKPTLIEYDNMRFLISDSPKNENLQNYNDEFKRYNVKYLVRTCELAYSQQAVEQEGIKVVDMYIEDGECPKQ